jgi:hypothetical protein
MSKIDALKEIIRAWGMAQKWYKFASSGW